MSRDPSEIILICWFAAQETFLIIIMLKTVDIFVAYILFFKILSRIKKQRLFELETFCNIINVFTVTFNQYNVSLCHNVSFL